MATTTIPQIALVATGLDGRELIEIAKPASADPVTSYVTARARVGMLASFAAGTLPQDANTVYAGPPSGSAEVPAFRALVAADMPAGIPAEDIEFLQSGTGAVETTAEEEFQQVYRPEQFGAVGDGSTDDTAALQALATQLRAVIGAVVEFGQNKTYKIFPTPSVGTDILFNLTGCRGVTLNFNGSIFSSPGTYTGGRVIRVIQLQNCAGITINDYRAAQTTTLAADYQNGLIGIYVIDTNRDIAINGFYQQYGRSCFECVRTSDLSVANRTHGIYVNGMTSDNVFYGFTLQKNGDQSTVRGLAGLNNGRVTHCYNVSQLDIEVESVPGSNTLNDCIAGVYTNSADSAVSNTLSEVRINYVSHQQTAACTGFHTTFIQQGDAVSTAGFIRNMEVNLDIIVPTAANTGIGYELAKQAFGAGPDSTTRGHVLDNMTVTGTLIGFGNNIDPVRIGVFGTWGGETIANFGVSNLISTSAGGTGAFVFDSTGFGSTVFDGVRFAQNLTWTNDTGLITYLLNSTFGNNASYTQLSNTDKIQVSNGQGNAPLWRGVEVDSSSNIKPSTSQVGGLGTSGRVWSGAHIAGTVNIYGASSGSAGIVAQAAAGTPTLTLPTATGTFVTTAVAPLSISATTGAISVGGLTSVAQGDIFYGSGTNTIAALAKDTGTTRVLTNQGGGNIPAWGLVNLSNGVSSTLAVGSGGTGTGSAGIGAFNNITGFTAAGSTGTTSTNLVFSTSPALTTPTLGAASATSVAFSSTSGIIGSATNDSAAAGSVGQLLSATLASGSATSLVTATAKTVISVSLTAGDWDVWGNAYFTGNVATTIANMVVSSLSATDNTLDATLDRTSLNWFSAGTAFNSSFGYITLPVGASRFSLSTTTTVYLVVRADFAVNTCSAYGIINARRRR